MPIRKRTIAFLPTESPANPSLLVDELRRINLDVLNEFRQSHRRFQSDQNVNVIGHAVDGDQFLFAVLNDASYVLVEFFFEFRSDQ